MAAVRLRYRCQSAAFEAWLAMALEVQSQQPQPQPVAAMLQLGPQPDAERLAELEEELKVARRDAGAFRAQMVTKTSELAQLRRDHTEALARLSKEEEEAARSRLCVIM